MWHEVAYSRISLYNLYDWICVPAGALFASGGESMSKPESRRRPNHNGSLIVDLLAIPYSLW